MAREIRQEPAFLFCLILTAGVFCLLLSWPIVAYDSDVWMHLTAGREIWRAGVPSSTFFSFLQPPRPWTDYHWLFQALVYAAYSAGGYPGLVVLRALLHLAFMGAVLAFLFRQPLRASSVYLAGVYLLFLFAFLPRSLVVRPHMVSYLFIPLFLHALEERKHLPWLPVLAALWYNLHGVSYPAMFAIWGAYAAEDLWDRRQGYIGGKNIPVTTQRPLHSGRWVLLCLLAVLLTPYGARLLPLPFRPLGHTQGFIQESAPARLSDFLAFSFHGSFPPRTLLNLLLLLAAGSAAASALREKRRLAHRLLLLAGALMLSRGSRLLHEFCLLALPILREDPLWTRAVSERLPRAVRSAALAGVFCLVAAQLWAQFQPRPAFPWSRTYLPQGTAAFLQGVPPGAKVLNFPVTGAYLSWALYPRHRIASDLNVWHAFTPEDLADLRSAFASPQGLGRMLERYRPDFISAPLEARRFPALISRFPDYSLVFFDDTDALYADRRIRPDLVKEWSPGADPFDPASFDPLDPRNKPAAPGAPPLWLARMIETDPHSSATRLMAVQVLSRQGAFEAALAHARAVVRDYPELPSGHFAEGDALRGLSRAREAIEAYRRALARADESSRAPIRRSLALAWLSLGDAGKAYQELRAAVDMDDPAASPQDLFHLALLALRAGEDADARWLMRRLYGDSEAGWGEALRRDMGRWGETKTPGHP